LLFDFFFLGRVSICCSYLRFKADLPPWENLYLIGLNPNCSKVWVLTSHFFFTPCIFNTWGYTLLYSFTPHKYWSLRLDPKKRLVKGFWLFGQILMDNHKPVMISILHFKTWEKCNFLIFFSWKYAWKHFRIWPYAWKQNMFLFFFCLLKRKINLKVLRFFLNFFKIVFRNISEKAKYFNTRFVSYSVKIEPNIKKKW